MIKALIGLLIAAIAAALIRAVIGMITKEVKDMVNPDQAGPQPQNPQQAPPESSPLKKCSVCGTYSPAERLVRGQFCSEACAAKAS